MNTLKKSLLLTAAAFALNASAQEVTLKFHHYWPQGALTVQKLVTPWCETIVTESKGRMKCQTFPAMTAGGTPAQLVDRVKDGVDDLILTVPGYTPGRFPMMEVFELPFMTRDAESASKAAWAYLQKNALSEFPKTKVLAMWVHDEGQIHTSNKHIKSLSDFKGLKLRAPSRLTTKLLLSLGASPVAMPITSVQDAISKGTVDGAMVPWDAATSFKLHDVAKFHTETPANAPALYTVTLMFAMNQARYDKLPADLKAIIDKHSGAKLSGFMGKMWDNSAAPARKLAEANGGKFYTLPATEIARWKDASDQVYTDWMIDMHKRGLDGRGLLSEAQKLITQSKITAK
jgi:TRAP-type C4-dicarboxylate transport system substrate-binding protein